MYETGPLPPRSVQAAGKHDIPKIRAMEKAQAAVFTGCPGPQGLRATCKDSQMQTLLVAHRQVPSPHVPCWQSHCLAQRPLFLHKTKE